MEELEDETKALQAEIEVARKRIGELESVVEENEVVDELLSKVNEVLDDTFDEGFEDIESAVVALIDEYHDAVEEAEDLA